MKKFFFLAIMSAFFLSSAELAASPPRMSKDELWRNSDTVIKGKVTDVKCTGEIIEEFCATLTGYTATVKVDSTLKGEHFKKINLHFYKYDFNHKCMGTEYTRHYKNEEAVYYLNCNEGKCRFTNWNGVDYIKKSKKPLPKCGKVESKGKK